MSEVPLADAFLPRELVRIRTAVSRRLRRFCSDFSDEQFRALVRDVSRSEFVHGLRGAEKQTRLDFFERNYRTDE